MTEVRAVSLKEDPRQKTADLEMEEKVCKIRGQGGGKEPAGGS
jgi:hypothetical protein